ncbi:hypothetical protein QWZ10_24280 [Paracoccus cavernae]|uniref:Uncharacterized protein n=1 Tax=Paracoccus cavernae TaxID=1571207 RepID=A0ABT8DCY2_9RHOB|nr:hypothetical protein [Paracoccus cavernae]
MIVLPIMLYNQIQIMVGAVLARRYAARDAGRDPNRETGPQSGTDRRKHPRARPNPTGQQRGRGGPDPRARTARFMHNLPKIQA